MAFYTSSIYKYEFCSRQSFIDPKAESYFGEEYYYVHSWTF